MKSCIFNSYDDKDRKMIKIGQNMFTEQRFVENA
jgi:hypothetical protein